MCYCTALSLNNLSHTFNFLGPNKQSQQSSVKLVLYVFVLKQKQRAPNKAPTLRCFPGTICFVPINLLFWTSCSILTHYNGT